jgi:hypothetical protein
MKGSAMKKKRDKTPTETVGNFEFTVRFATSSTPEAAERWERRAEALTAWLLSLWEQEQEAKAGQKHDGPSGSPGTK